MVSWNIFLQKKLCCIIVPDMIADFEICCNSSVHGANSVWLFWYTVPVTGCIVCLRLHSSPPDDAYVRKYFFLVFCMTRLRNSSFLLYNIQKVFPQSVRISQMKNAKMSTTSEVHIEQFLEQVSAQRRTLFGNQEPLFVLIGRYTA